MLSAKCFLSSMVCRFDSCQLMRMMLFGPIVISVGAFAWWRIIIFVGAFAQLILEDEKAVVFSMVSFSMVRRFDSYTAHPILEVQGENGLVWFPLFHCCQCILQKWHLHDLEVEGENGIGCSARPL